MEVDTDDEILQVLADGGQMNYEQWPDLFSRLIPRLEKIVQEDFSLPKSFLKPETTDDDRASSQATDKENAPPTSTPGTLPPPLQALFNSTISNLNDLFPKHPPHTIQRLAELILHPKQHYRTLPAYLHALDRVVHVTSGAQTFPLPPAIPDTTAASRVLSNGSLPNGADPLSISWANPTTPLSGLGSDESLGGALLTPITWLTKPTTNGTHSPLEGEVTTESTEMVDGPNGPGGVETVSVSVNGISSTRDTKDIPIEDTSAALRAEGGVTQGELLRQEQKAGVVPMAQLQHHRADTDGLGEDDEMPHARGPEEIGMEDMGPQAEISTLRRAPNMGMQGIDVEAAVGVHPSAREAERDVEKEVKMEEGNVTPKREAEDEKGGDGKRFKDGDGDTVIVDVDADGREEGEEKVGEKGENKGADAVDATTS